MRHLVAIKKKTLISCWVAISPSSENFETFPYTQLRFQKCILRVFHHRSGQQNTKEIHQNKQSRLKRRHRNKDLFSAINYILRKEEKIIINEKIKKKKKKKSKKNKGGKKRETMKVPSCDRLRSSFVVGMRQSIKLAFDVDSSFVAFSCAWSPSRFLYIPPSFLSVQQLETSMTSFASVCFRSNNSAC